MSPTLAIVVDALLEYMKIGLAVAEVLSISTLVASVVDITWVAAFPAISLKSILNVTVPEGSLAVTALDCADHPMRSVATPVVASIGTVLPSMVISEVVMSIFSLAVNSSSTVLPLLAFCCPAGLSERVVTKISVGSSLS